jgi:hypothetical protein
MLSQMRGTSLDKSDVVGVSRKLRMRLHTVDMVTVNALHAACRLELFSFRFGPSPSSFASAFDHLLLLTPGLAHCSAPHGVQRGALRLGALGEFTLRIADPCKRRRLRTRKASLCQDRPADNEHGGGFG